MKTDKVKVKGILEKIKKLQCSLEKEQSECSHDNVKSERNSNTGNYDPNDNEYWVNVECLDCGKYMMFDYEKDRENYHKYLK